MKDVYKIDRYEADFSCGNTVKGVCKESGNVVFIKRWHSENIRAQNEIFVTNKIENESVSRFFDTFDEEGMTYAVRKWIDASSLLDFTLKEKSLSLDKALDIMIKICAVLRDIAVKYGDFVHSDIRPSNFLYDEKSMQIWLIDLETFTFFDEKNPKCVSDLLNRGGYTISLSAGGFTAPEVYSGEICMQSDVFSLGKLFAFLIGICSYDGEILRTKNTKVCKSAMKIIKKCTAVVPGKRYDSVGVLLDEFCNLFNDITMGDVRSEIQENSDKCSEKVIVLKKNEDKLKIDLKTLNKRDSSIVYVAANSCFASEFAYLAAARRGIKTILLENDSNIGIGAFDYFIDRYYDTQSSIVCEQHNSFFCDCRHLYLTDEEQWLTRGILSKSRKNEKLYVSDCNVFSEFDISDMNDLKLLLEWTGKHFDMTVICDSSDKNGAISDHMVMSADYIIVPVRPNIDEVYASFKYYKQRYLKSGCRCDKLMFVAWEYEDGISMPLNDFKIAVDNLYGGYIPYDSERLKCKNIKGNFFCEQYDNEIYLSYNSLLERISAL